MLHTIRLAAVAMTVVALLGCASTKLPDTSQRTLDASDEWRLRTLEEKALGQRNAQLELTTQVTELSRRVQAMEQRWTSTPSKPAPLLSSTDLPESGPVMEKAKPEPEMAEPAPASDSKSGAQWDAYPDATGRPKQPMTNAKMTAGTPAPKAKASVAVGKSAYDKALALVLAGKSAQGRAAMEQFLGANPKSSLAPNAIYWLGETYYHEKQFAEAVVAFKKVHQQYPRHEKAAAALLKIGYCYAALGDTGNARFYLGVLTEDYPKSDPAALGRKRLKSLK